MADDGTEKRKHPRIEAVFKVSYPGGQPGFDHTENLSEGGLFIATDRDLAPGDRVGLELSFPGLLAPVSLIGEVMWRRAAGTDPDRSPGVGIRLLIDNPQTRAWIVELIAQLSEQEPRPPATPAARYRVLIAEDNAHARALFRQALTTRLEETAAEVVEVTSGPEALEELSAQPTDLLIIAWRLCEQNERTLLEQIRKRPEYASLAVVVIGSAADDRAAILAAGADMFLSRPVVGVNLVKTVRSLLTRRKAR